MASMSLHTELRRSKSAHSKERLNLDQGIDCWSDRLLFDGERGVLCNTGRICSYAYGVMSHLVIPRPT